MNITSSYQFHVGMLPNDWRKENSGCTRSNITSAPGWRHGSSILTWNTWIWEGGFDSSTFYINLGVPWLQSSRHGHGQGSSPSLTSTPAVEEPPPARSSSRASHRHAQSPSVRSSGKASSFGAEATSEFAELGEDKHNN